MSEPLSAAAMSWLEERCETHRLDPSHERFSPTLVRCDALVVRTYTRVDEALLSMAPGLRVVGRAGVGLDNIDLEACHRRGVRVVHTPDANTQAVVEYVVCLLADALRPRPALPGPVSAEAWNQLRATQFAPRQMSECVLGILGLGRIGTRVAEVARAIGMTVLYNDLRDIAPAARKGATPVAPDSLFERSDVLTVHIDGRPQNRLFVDGRLIDRLPRHAVFLNTSRGMVVDHAALARFLAANPSARAFLDVHEPEPPSANNPLWGLPNAVLLPHLASRTATAMEGMSWVVRDVWAALSERVPAAGAEAGR